MHMHLRTAIVGLILMVSPTAVFADQKVELFNGKDLTGWTKRGGNGTYKVEDGEIVGRSAPNTTNTFLCTDKEFGDFEMELDFKIDPKQNIFNSGVQIRSHSRPEKDKKSGKESSESMATRSRSIRRAIAPGPAAFISRAEVKDEERQVDSRTRTAG